MNRKYHRGGRSMRFTRILETRKDVEGGESPVRLKEFLWLGVVLVWAYATALIYYVRLGWAWFAGGF